MNEPRNVTAMAMGPINAEKATPVMKSVLVVRIRGTSASGKLCLTVTVTITDTLRNAAGGLQWTIHDEGHVQM